MTYASKHTDSAVELKKQPHLPTSRDRYLRIPDPLSSQIRIPKQLGRSGSIEPIRSDNTHPHPTSHASSAPPVDSKNGTTIHQNKKTQLKNTKNKNSHKKSYTFSIFTPHNRISIIAPNHLTLYSWPQLFTSSCRFYGNSVHFLQETASRAIFYQPETRGKLKTKRKITC